ncbi:GNAT family N-acetyltransferase [Rhodobacteraceae bacterium CCMM004]|nr:GNAT family N-acetyltransferase [Rhodobacteraceae bacterium CCMM004]
MRRLRLHPVPRRPQRLSLPTRERFTLRAPSPSLRMTVAGGQGRMGGTHENGQQETCAGFHVAPARPEDAAALAALQAASWRAAYRGAVPDDALGGRLDAEMAAKWDPLPPGAIVLWEAAVPLGFVRVVRRQGWPYIDNLHVRPDRRGRGLGRPLMRAAADAVAAEGRLWLTVLAENRGARRFYARCGGWEGAPLHETLLGARVAARPVLWPRLVPLMRLPRAGSENADARVEPA